MLLLASGDVKSCAYNSKILYNKFLELKNKNLSDEKTKGDGSGQLRWTKTETFFFVNIAFIYIKCLLV